MSLSPRLCALASLPVFLLAATLSAQLDDPRWPSRIIPQQDENEGARQKPPVVTAVAMQPGGPLMATAGDDHYIRVWDMEQGILLHRLEGHADWVRTLAFSPDGSTLASAGNDRTIVLWEPKSGEKLATLAKHPQAVVAICYRPDGRHLASAGFEDRLRVYDLETGDVAFDRECPCQDMRAISYSPNGALLAGGGRNGKIRVWHAADGRQAYERQIHRQRIRAIAFSPDNTQLVSCSEDRSVQLWTLADDSPPRALPRRGAKVFSLAFVGPGKLAVGGSDNLIRLWDLATLAEIDQLAGHTGSIAALAYRDGRLVSGSYDTTVRVWTVQFDGPRGPANATTSGLNPVPLGGALGRNESGKPKAESGRVLPPKQSSTDL